MKNIEHVEFSNIPDDQGNVELPPSGETEAIKNYWNKFRLPGNPPKAGSIAEKRLVNACSEYATYLFNLANMSWGDSSALARGSDEIRREKHNNIAIMIVGQQRSGMNDVLAKKIADFAVYLTYKDSIVNVLEDFRKIKNKE